MTDGYKYNDRNGAYLRIREVSDSLCREYGLSVVEDPRRGRKSIAEIKAEKNGEYTIRGAVRRAVDEAVKGSVNMWQFEDAMDQMGYIIDHTGRYPKLRQLGIRRFVRFSSLGNGYDYEDIMTRIMENDCPGYPDIPEQESPQAVFDNCAKDIADMTYTDLLKCFIRAAEITADRSETNRHMFFLMENEHSKLDRYRYQLKVASENGIESYKDVLDFREKLTGRKEELLDMRRELRNALERAQRKGDTQEVTEIKKKREEVTRKLAECRKENEAAGRIAEQSGFMREKLQIIADGKFRGKDAIRNEHIGRGGRSGPPNDDRRD